MSIKVFRSLLDDILIFFIPCKGSLALLAKDFVHVISFFLCRGLGLKKWMRDQS